MTSEDLDPIHEFLDEQKVGYRTKDGGHFDHRFITLSYAGENTTVECSLHYNEGASIFIVYGAIPIIIPEEKITEAIIIANFANRFSKYGALIVDSSDGKVWTRLASASEDTQTAQVYDAMIVNACEMMDSYFPLLMKVIYANLSGEKAIEEYIKSFDNENDEGGTPPPPISGYM